jgi:hypothetical protein
MSRDNNCLKFSKPCNGQALKAWAFLCEQPIRVLEVVQSSDPGKRRLEESQRPFGAVGSGPEIEGDVADIPVPDRG